MFSYLLYSQYLSPTEPYWGGFHVGMVWALGVYLDALLVFVLIGAHAAMMAARRGSRERGYARLALIRDFLARIDRLTIILAGIFLIAMVLVTFLSVIGRNLWMSIPDDISFAEWFLVAMVALMLGAAQGRGEHIEITALTDKLPRRHNQGLRLIAMLFGALILVRFGYVNLAETPDAFFEEVYGSIYHLPQWPPRFVFFVGIAWWVARLLLQFFALVATELAARDDEAVIERWQLSPLLTRDDDLLGVGLEDLDLRESDRSVSMQAGGDRHGT
ncbi:MAG: TRAP transporter small permease [Gemmatimonadales bacterium]|nr:TRAP transporter small permease [Gemmatimonadales bacterium]